MRHWSRVLYVFALVAGLLPVFASAHAFGQQYTLPLPFYLFAEGAVGALVVSFLILSLYSEPVATQRQRFTKTFSVRSRILMWLLKIIGLACFVFTLACAFLGSNNFAQNPTPILFWIVLFLGMTYVHAIVAGLWRLLNPFETIVQILFLGRTPPALFEYPRWLGYWPALIVYFGFIWLELLSGGVGTLPAVLGLSLVWYGFISCAGAILFGPAVWFTYGDFFSVFFETIGRFAPITLAAKQVVIEPPGERLVTERAEHLSMLVFILFMLSSTAFDGMHETQLWWSTFYRGDLPLWFHQVEESFLLLLSPFLFLALYGGAIYAMRLIVDARQSFRELLLRFAYSLIPIAIAYNVAHYLTLLVYQVQTLIPLLSDPFSKGWNIFGAGGGNASLYFIDAQIVWYTQFGAIIGGHIIATYVAHRVATREFDSQKKIILGQLPILILMVFYTVFGLWILSQAYQTS